MCLKSLCRERKDPTGMVRLISMTWNSKQSAGLSRISPHALFFSKCFELSTSQRSKSVNSAGGTLQTLLQSPLLYPSSIHCKPSLRTRQIQASGSTSPTMGGIFLQWLRAHVLNQMEWALHSGIYTTSHLSDLEQFK